MLLMVLVIVMAMVMAMLMLMLLMILLLLMMMPPVLGMRAGYRMPGAGVQPAVLSTLSSVQHEFPRYEDYEDYY